VRYLKATAVGLGAGLFGAVLWIALTVVLPVELQIAEQARNGSGGVAVSRSFSTLPLMAIFLLSFIVAFALSLRRSRRKA